MEDVLVIVLICAAVSLIVNVVLKKLQVESVIGYILTGMAVGFGFDLEHNPTLGMVAELGIVFLMFTIGLEFSPQKLRSMKKEVFLFGALQMTLTSAAFFVVGHWALGLPPTVNLIVSIALALSSTAIVLNLLTKNRKVSSGYGRNSVGILLFQDIAVIPLLLMVSIFSSTHESVSGLLLDVLIDGSIVFVLLFAGGRFVTPYLMEQVIAARSNELFVGAILLFVVSAAQLAHSLGFSYSLGAFLAGMVIAETHYKHQVEADLIPFRDLLLGVFFITVGMQVNPLFVLDNIVAIALVMAGLLVVKIAVLFVTMRVFSHHRASLKTALLLSQCGEFSFVVFETAQASNLFMDPELGQVLVMAIVFTMMLTPFIFRFLDPITDFMSRSTSTSADQEDEVTDSIGDQQVVICGFGRLGQQVGLHLENAGIDYVGIELESSAFAAMKQQGMPVVFGNAGRRQFLEGMKIDQASAVIIAMSNEQRILLVVQSIRQAAPDVPILVCAANDRLKDELLLYGVANPVDNLEQTAAALVESVINRAELEQA